MFSFNFRVIFATHPFSAIMATFAGSTIIFKFLGYGPLWIRLTIFYLSAQLFTGLLNDYLDFDLDKDDQPQKPSTKGLISKYDIKLALVIIVIGFLIILLMMPIDVIVILLLGLVIAQTYNFGLKDTPLSVLVFGLAFSFMLITPYFIKFGYDVQSLPIMYILSLGIISICLHIANDVVDFEIDRLRKSRSFVQYIGEMNSYRLMILLSFIYLVLNKNEMPAIFVYLPSIIVIFFSSPFFNKRLNLEYGYYLLSMIYFLQIILLPLK